MFWYSMRVKWKSAGLTWDLYCLFLKDLSGEALSCLIVRSSISQGLQPLPAGQIDRNLSGTWIFFALLCGVFHPSLGVCHYWRKDTGFAERLVWVLTAIPTSCLCKMKCIFGRAPVHSVCCPIAHGVHLSCSLCWSFCVDADHATLSLHSPYYIC